MINSQIEIINYEIQPFYHRRNTLKLIKLFYSAFF